RIYGAIAGFAKKFGSNIVFKGMNMLVQCCLFGISNWWPAGEYLIIERAAVLLSCVCRFSKRHMDFLFWIDCKKVLW
ncbi:MAG: hypothetical protein IKE08_08770, partial [Clostridia bacterium]|nr:hypothetical protein [Clostridia bacterium]